MTSPATATRSLELRLPPTRSVAMVLAAIGVAVIVMGFVGTAIELSSAVFAGREEVVTLLSLSSEFNIPTMVAVLWLATCALLLFIIGRVQKARGDRFAGRWLLLAGIFAYLAMDEGAHIHEHLSKPLAGLPITTGYLRWGWVLIGGLGVLVLLPLYVPLLRTLPARVRNATILAGTLYVGAALGFELIQARVSLDDGFTTPRYLALTIMEESAELAGIGLFIVVLWSLLQHWAPVLTLRHDRGAETVSATADPSLSGLDPDNVSGRAPVGVMRAGTHDSAENTPRWDRYSS